MASNSFGHIFKFTSFGESHGKAIGCIVDGVPPLISIEEKDIQHYLDRRKPGQSKFVTQRKESDTVEILSGTFEGKTTGHPIALQIKNEDQRSKDYSEIAKQFKQIFHRNMTFGGLQDLQEELNLINPVDTYLAKQVSQLKVNKNEPKTNVQGSRTTRQEEANGERFVTKVVKEQGTAKEFGF